MVMGWTIEFVSIAASNKGLLNGKTHLPSELVPSGNKINFSHRSSCSLINLTCSWDALRSRRMKIVRVILDKNPKIGQLVTSDFAINLPGTSDPRIIISR